MVAFAERRANVPISQLAEEYLLADGIFAATSSGTIDDLERAVRATSDWSPSLLRPEVMRWFGDTIRSMYDTVLKHRRVALERALASTRPPTGDAARPPPGPRPTVTCPGDPVTP